MLKLVIKGQEMWDEGANNGAGEFVDTPDVVLTMEHSLLSLSKWEQFYEKPFLGREKKTNEEALAYFRFMCLDEDVDPDLFYRLTKENFEEINAYIEKSHTATWFTEAPGGRRMNPETATSEIIYYWMSALNIDEAQWEGRHLSRLFTFIKVVNEKNKPQKKMSRSETIERQRALNAQRRAASGSTG